MAEDLVVTPGGFRPRSQVHRIEPEHVLDGTDSRLQAVGPAGEVVADFGMVGARAADTPLMPGNVLPRAGVEPSFGSGWIAYADWTNFTGHPITSFATTWAVPPAPRTHNDQTIFLFNGIQNSTMIYQPVLQWGESAAGGGDYWAVASWYVDGQNGPAFYSQLVRVNPGDTLIGVMTLSSQSGNKFSYNCTFEGIAHTSLRIQNVEELTWCIETLEAYDITACSDYPDTVDSAFTAISIETGSSSPALSWEGVDSYTECAQHCAVVSNKNPGGEVDIYYRHPGDIGYRHVFFASGDGHVHELDTSKAHGARWGQNDLTARAGAPVAQSGSAMAGFDEPNFRHVFFVSGDGHVHELYMAKTSGAKWSHNDLTAQTGAPLATAGGGLTAFADDAFRHVFFVSGDSHVHELYMATVGATKWSHNDLTTQTAAPVAAASGGVAGFADSGFRHVLFAAGDGHVHELYVSLGSSAKWSHNDLSAQTSAPASAADSPLAGFAGAGSRRVYFVSGDGHVHELYMQIAAQARWTHDDVTAQAGAPAAGSATGLTGFSEIGFRHVFFVSGDGHVHELYMSTAAGAKWSHNDLTARAGAPPAGSDAALTSFNEAQFRHVFFVAGNGHIHELYMAKSPGAKWGHNDLSATTGAPLAGAASAVASFDETN